jgi:haloacetate dehalogenase
MKTYKITVPRGTFNVRDSGNTDGYPVIMQHGWPESSYCWEPIRPFLSDKLRVIAPDLRGLGDSERTMTPDLYRKQELANDVLQIVDELGIKEFFLVGHDWGGAVVQEMAIARPERTKKLVLMNFPVLSNTAGNAEAIAVMRGRGSVPLMYQYFQQQDGLPEKMIKGNEDVWIEWCFSLPMKEGKISRKTVQEYIRCYKTKNTPATGAYYYRTMKHDAKRWVTLGGFKYHMPALYIYGTRDFVVIPEYLNHIENCFDDIRVIRIEAGHFLQEEEPEKVGGLINDFLSV